MITCTCEYWNIQLYNGLEGIEDTYLVTYLQGEYEMPSTFDGTSLDNKNSVLDKMVEINKNDEIDDFNLRNYLKKYSLDFEEKPFYHDHWNNLKGIAGISNDLKNAIDDAKAKKSNVEKMVWNCA